MQGAIAVHHDTEVALSNPLQAYREEKLSIVSLQHRVILNIHISPAGEGAERAWMVRQLPYLQRCLLQSALGQSPTPQRLLLAALSPALHWPGKGQAFAPAHS
jgi:hypothetical protein